MADKTQNKKILVTGHLGFIGFHCVKKLLDKGLNVVGIDSLNNYYDVNLKKSRLVELNNHKNKNFESIIHNLANIETKDLLKKLSPNIIINLAAQAGVRHSLKNPEDYVENNIYSYLNILEYAKEHDVEKIVYASTSSVYGGNEKLPFSETDEVIKPLQFYAVTKRTNELMSEAYSSLYGIKSIGLRFFTVYGPFGRPDMALFLFTKNILDDLPIDVFNNGKHMRNFTYVDDIVEGVVSAAIKKPKFSMKDHEIFNLASREQIDLMDFIKEIEINLGKKAKMNFMPLQKGDVPSTASDISKMEKFFDYSPKTSMKEGVKNFIDWYLEYYKKN